MGLQLRYVVQYVYFGEVCLPKKEKLHMDVVGSSETSYKTLLFLLFCLMNVFEILQTGSVTENDDDGVPCDSQSRVWASGI